MTSVLFFEGPSQNGVITDGVSPAPTGSIYSVKHEKDTAYTEINRKQSETFQKHCFFWPFSLGSVQIMLTGNLLSGYPARLGCGAEETSMRHTDDIEFGDHKLIDYCIKQPKLTRTQNSY